MTAEERIEAVTLAVQEAAHSGDFEVVAKAAIIAVLQSLLEPVKALYPGYEGDDSGKGAAAMQEAVVDLIQAAIKEHQ